MDPEIGTAPGIRKVAMDTDDAFPGFGSANAVTVPSDVKLRFVSGTFNVKPTTGNAAGITLWVETGVGTGIYVGWDEFSQEATGLTDFPQLMTIGLHAPVKGGHRYYWSRVGSAGTTETNIDYNFTDAW